MTDNDRPRRAKQMAWQTIDGETVLLNVRGRELLGLNDVAARVWLLADGSRTLGEIVATVATEFDVDAVTARADVQTFLADLTAAGAVEI